MLAHEKLDVYRCSIDFLGLSARIGGAVPRGNSILLEQLKRAALSIPLNIAEGAGKQGIRERKRYYGIARGHVNSLTSRPRPRSHLKCHLSDHLSAPKMFNLFPDAY